jgi:hypothetical protein
MYDQTVEMLKSTLNRIVEVEGSTNNSLLLRYTNGELLEVDFLLLQEKAKNAETGILVDFKEASYLAKAQVNRQGALEWPNGYDSCADALYLRGRIIESNLDKVKVG